jgi:hypothetical protein
MFRYFFPKRATRDRIGQAAGGFAGKDTVYGKVSKAQVRLMIAANAARNEAQARARIAKHPDLTFEQIIALYRRKRQPRWLAQAWRRLKALWCIVFVFCSFLSVQKGRAESRPTATVTASMLNVRSCPSADCEIFGQLGKGARFLASGRSEDSGWVSLLYWDKPAWISARYIDIDVSTLPSALYILSWEIEPAAPELGQIFVARFTIAGITDTVMVAARCGDQFFMSEVDSAGVFVISGVVQPEFGAEIEVILDVLGTPQPSAWQTIIF